MRIVLCFEQRRRWTSKTKSVTQKSFGDGATDHKAD